MAGPRRAGRHRPSASDARGPDRAILGVFRALVAAVLVTALALGAVVAAPYVVDELEERTSPVVFEEPPPAGDRNPELVDPDDPNRSTYDATAGTITSNVVEDFVHQKVNERRAEHGLEPIEWDGTVASVSRAHSVDMADRSYFNHTNPDGENPMDRFNDVGGYCRSYGENIAMTWVDRKVRHPDGSTTKYETPEALAEGLVEQWMNSPPHRRAILEESWDRGGVGVYLADDGQVFATHNFCETSSSPFG